MKATTLEFHYRFFFIGAIFFLSFQLYALDHLNAAEAIAGALHWSSVHAAQYFIGLGALIVVVSAAVRTWATAYLQSDVVHDKALHHSSVLADGPYRYVRNPLYLGNTLLAIGMGLMASRLGWFFLVIGTTLFDYRLIFREEAELDQAQGESYRAFSRAVPRLIPALTPRLPASGLQPRWAQAFAGEIFFWGFAVAELTFAITLSQPILFSMIILSLAVYMVQFLFRKRRP